jgi:phage replication-related protein YjqB (UPF0714/DUF867 family)
MDKYQSFDQLKKNEPSDAYAIDVRPRSLKYVIIAPHGGGIEPGTTEIARHIAGDLFSYFSFSGTKITGNKELHISSDRYDEPAARELVESSDIAITIHGAKGDSQNIYIGGLNDKLISAMSVALREAGFPVSRSVPSNLSGRGPNNICNVCKTKQGVQIEISNGLRKSMFKGMHSTGRTERTEMFEKFVQVIRKVLAADC